MPLDKAIKYGKEHRKPYVGAKAIARSCRNHGGCPWCERGRLHSSRKRELAASYGEEEIHTLRS